MDEFVGSAGYLADSATQTLALHVDEINAHGFVVRD
jgi:hypothetical protein